jgi:hypothetical protein
MNLHAVIHSDSPKKFKFILKSLGFISVTTFEKKDSNSKKDCNGSFVLNTSF